MTLPSAGATTRFFPGGGRRSGSRKKNAKKAASRRNGAPHHGRPTRTRTAPGANAAMMNGSPARSMITPLRDRTMPAENILHTIFQVQLSLLYLDFLDLF
jgi:hypothetical protein